MPAAFKDNLINRYPFVALGLERKIWSCQQMAKYVKRKAALEQEMALLTKKLLAKTPEVLWFEEGGMSQLWEALLKRENEAARTHQAMHDQLVDRVSNQLSMLIDTTEQTKKSLTASGNALMKKFNDSNASLAKAKEKYFKASRDVESSETLITELESDNFSKKSDITKTEKKLAKQTDEAAEAETSYRQQILSSNSIQDEFYTKSMPSVLNELQLIYEQRVHKMKEVFKSFYEIVGTGLSVMQPVQHALEETVTAVNPFGEVLEYIQKMEVPFPGVIPYEFEAYIKGQGAPSGAVKKGWMSTSKKSLKDQSGSSIATGPAATTSVFHVNLDDLLARQQEQYPHLKIPRAIKFLCELVLHLEGEKTQGIFRISGSAIQIEEGRDSLNKGVFKQIGGVHETAGLLKLFLRGLPDPIIPNSLYNACLTTENPVSVFKQLPEANKNTLGYLLRFFQRFCTPEAQENTSMSPESIAAVIAPCVMRCPFEDLTETLVAAASEKKFTYHLFTSLVLAPDDAPQIEEYNTEEWGDSTSTSAPPTPARSSSAGRHAPRSQLPATPLPAPPKPKRTAQPQPTTPLSTSPKLPHAPAPAQLQSIPPARALPAMPAKPLPHPDEDSDP